MEQALQNNRIESILKNYKQIIGNDYEAYRGHCHRIYNYIVLMKRSAELTQQDNYILEIAIPFHDLGIWTAHTMDYLQPSFEAASTFVKQNKLDVDLFVLKTIIVNHHKLTFVKDNKLAELLRKADMLDLSFGRLKSSLTKEELDCIKASFPYKGFQLVIFKKLMKHALKNITNPFPMLKW